MEHNLLEGWVKRLYLDAETLKNTFEFFGTPSFELKYEKYNI
jgi:hypothetical protein